MKQRFPFNLSYWTSSQEHAVTLRAGTHFRLDIGAISRFCLRDLPPRLLDMLRVPFFDYTKGQMVEKLAGLRLRELATLSGSCIGFPLRHFEAKHCGVCAACLFRRQAMYVGGIDEPGGSYKYDIFSRSHSNSIRPERLKYLKAFLLQVAQLNGAETHDRLPGPFERHTLSTNILRRGQSQKGLIDLLVRYRDEWTTIASEARRNNLSWAKWLAPRAKEQHAEGVIHASA